jgi:hypothetical protein
MAGSRLADALFRSLTGEKFDSWKLALPKPEDVTNDVIRELGTNHPLVPVGHTAEYATFNITEEERRLLDVADVPEVAVSAHESHHVR